MQTSARDSGGNVQRQPAWPQVVAAAQSSLADALAEAISARVLDRQRYQHWLAMEFELARIGAGVLERLAAWHGGEPVLRATALAWATSLREDARTAAADVRELDGIAMPPPAPLVRWHLYAESACRSQRAGEALGTVLLHAQLLEGAERGIVELVLELPFLAMGANRWLKRRSGVAPTRGADDRQALIDAWSATALAAGAQRAADWHREALAEVLRAPADARRQA
jgi:hypothetical protein